MKLADLKRLAKILAPHAAQMIDDARTLRELTIVAQYVGNQPGAPPPRPALFSVRLINCGSNKIGVIKVVRNLTNLSLMDSNDLCDRAFGSGAAVLVDVDLARANHAVKMLREAGAEVSVQ